jgi:hypothetical protein
MKIIKYTKSSSIGKSKFRMALFKCPLCDSEVEKRASIGKGMKSCSTKCFNSNNPRTPRKKRVFISKYYYLLKKDHIRANGKGYVAEHTLVMEEFIGRYLNHDEVVHHKNENGLDNRIENLQLMTASEHMSYHAKNRKRNKDGKFK